MESQLSFGADCVIRLEDLGEFKDYSDTLESLSSMLEPLRKGSLKEIPNELWQIIDADPEDTFFLPDFQKVLSVISSIDWALLASQQQNLKIISFYLKIVEEALISFTFGEQIVDPLINQILDFKKQGIKIQKLILRLLFNLSDKVVYIEEFNKVAMLWNILNEKDLFKCYDEKIIDVVAAAYAQCCQKYLRNRELRKLIIEQDENRPFLLIKLSLWQRNKVKFADNFKKIQAEKYYHSDFLKQACLSFQETISQI